MRTTLAELAAAHRTLGDERFVATWAPVFLVSDPESAFNIPSGPRETLRVDRSAFLASSRGEFHATSPAFAIKRRPESVYSFVSIGRTENCDIQIPDDTVSKLHALLRAKEGIWTVHDADSANGTFVDELPVPGRAAGEPAPLHPGSILRVGQVKLHFQDLGGLKALFEETGAYQHD